MRNTKIQWADDTVNPIMGCHGCELFTSPGRILAEMDRRLSQHVTWQKGTARQMALELIKEAWSRSFDGKGVKPGLGHRNKLTTSNLHHLRKEFNKRVSNLHGKEWGALAQKVIEENVTCYAAKLTLNKGYSIENPTRQPNTGYAPTFEQVTQFEGRIEAAARCKDLLGTQRTEKPWLDGLPRLIFVSDMGDALSRKSDAAFLRREFAHITGVHGSRHLWLWLTKRPSAMADFAKSLGGLPANVCAMTTVTSNGMLHRVDELRGVDAKVRGLSIEPLWTPISRSQLNLKGIDWVILGGESGRKDIAKPFYLEWVLELMEQCREEGVACFVKQLGSHPVKNGRDIKLQDKHGGNWEEWEKRFRVREMPAYFENYRRATTC